MRPRAVIFDSDPLIRQMLKELCQRRGFETLTFPDPGLCPLHATNHCPCEEETACSDFIFSDLESGGTEGLDHVEALQAKGCQCHHIALLSGTWSPSEQARAEDLGCKLFIKPLEVRNIIQWMDQGERELRLTRQLRDMDSLRNSLNESGGSA